MLTGQAQTSAPVATQSRRGPVEVSPALVRGTLLALVAVLVLLQERTTPALLTVLALAGLGALASRWPPATVLGWAAVCAEVITVCAAVAPTGGTRSPLLPYLLAPACAAGLAVGLRAAVLVSGLAAGTLVVLRLRGVSAPADTVEDYTAATAQWISLGLAAGLVAAWLRQVLADAARDSDPRYAAAYGLLLELRQVARTLPGTLDTAGTTGAVLEQLAGALPFDAATVLLSNGDDHLVPAAVRGAERAAWATTADGDGPVALAWRSVVPAVDGDSVALPWQASGRVTAVVVLSRAGGGFSPDELAAAEAVLESSALRLDTALLFDEIRTLATVEERRRLGREIHDGIAQEVVYLGYELDAALIALRHDPVGAQDIVTRLREQTTRMLAELRLSVYDLRNEVDGERGLAAAVSDLVRKIGITSDLTVHLTLAQSGERLAVATESEVLRIAQEAVSNARRHSGARNLWVELVVEPPMVSLRVEDDGSGIGGPDAPGFGLGIMRERAERIGAQFMVRPRTPTGTCVALLLRGR